VAVTVACGTTAPEGSVILPRKIPDEVCAETKPKPIENNKKKMAHERICSIRPF
jgi:hypothetical protein